MRAYVAVVGSYLACTYAAVIRAVAERRTQLDANGAPDFINHPAGWYATATHVFVVLLPAFWVSFVVAQMLSWRRSSGERRQQLKWLLAGAAVMAVPQAVLQPVLSLPNLSDAAQGILNTIATLFLAALPVGLGVAILRYRLYEIDRIVSRTIGWAIVTGVLVAMFAGLVVALESALASVTREDTLAVAASTLIAAALFQPLRRRVQRSVDRRFDRTRYDGQRTVNTFVEQLRNEVDLVTIQSSLATTANTAVRPVSAEVWLRTAGAR
jgi:hypothetical protein